jgi:hypothetical protein
MRESLSCYTWRVNGGYLLKLSLQMYDLSTDSPEKLYTVTNFANFAYFDFDLKNTNNKEYLGHIVKRDLATYLLGDLSTCLRGWFGSARGTNRNYRFPVTLRAGFGPC